MALQTYLINSTADTSKPTKTCSLYATLKHDEPGCPHRVYNEYVACRLGKLFNVPVVDGVLVLTDSGYAFAEMMPGCSGMTLPDAIYWRYAELVNGYPNEIASLVVFDILIGNNYRGNNVKVTYRSPQHQIFAAYNHGKTLLGIWDTPQGSIDDLSCESWTVEDHPGFMWVTQDLATAAIERMCSIPHELVRECCILGHQLNDVTPEIQESLADALCRRMGVIWDLNESEPHYICRWNI